VGKFPHSGAILNKDGWGQPLYFYTLLMPWGLKRYQQFGQIHFITFSCYRRRPFLNSTRSKHVFELALERTRRQYGLLVYGYVVMPEHVHLLVSEPVRSDLAQALKSLKQGVSRQRIGNREHFWQKRYYDFNIHLHRTYVEKLRYIHRNPVKRGLCARPEDWRWSSFVHYATGVEGIVEIESPWTATKRERVGVPLIAH
jgi:putative transposase